MKPLVLRRIKLLAVYYQLLGEGIFDFNISE